MTKQETLAFLTAQGIAWEITEHAAVYNMAELDSVELPYPDADAKNLFVRDENKMLRISAPPDPLSPEGVSLLIPLDLFRK